MAILFTISRLDRDFSCTADGGARFFVGRRVTYEGRIGLYNVFAGSKLEKLRYKAADFETEYGFWASVIEPTATVEGVVCSSPSTPMTVPVSPSALDSSPRMSPMAISSSTCAPC